LIYLDNNATTRVDMAVREAMLPYLEDAYGNPNSVHQAGNRARVAVERARGQMARALGVTASEIVFTGCGSESDNQAVIGALLARRGEGKNLVTSSIEHPAVARTCAWAAEQLGFENRVAPFRVRDGAVDPSAFTELIDENTVLVTVMAASNETGVVMPLAPIFARAHEVGAICHTDAVQAFGKLPVSPREIGADLLSLSAHKFHGPKGIGILYVRRGVKIAPLIHGGAQENGRRAGTENVAQIVAMGRAAELAVASDSRELAAMRDRFETRLRERVGEGFERRAGADLGHAGRGGFIANDGAVDDRIEPELEDLARIAAEGGDTSLVMHGQVVIPKKGKGAGTRAAPRFDSTGAPDTMRLIVLAADLVADGVCKGAG